MYKLHKSEHSVLRSSSSPFRKVLLAAIFSLSVACQPTVEEHFAQAEKYMAEADYQSAIIELRNVLQANPDDVNARLLRAEASYQVADFATAEANYKRVLALGDDRPDVWAGLGKSMLMQGKVREAFESVVPNLAGKSDQEDHLVVVGDILMALGNLPDAEAEYLKAIEQNPVSPGGLVGRAAIAASQGDHDRARQYLDEATEGNPESDFAWRANGNYLRTHSEFDDAIAAYDRSMLLETATTPLADRFITRMNRVTSLIDLNRFEEAQADFAALQAALPGHPQLSYLKGRIAFGLGDYNQAQIELQQYLSRVPDDPRGKAMLGAVNFSQNNLRQAEIYLSQAVRANVGGETTRRLLAETLLRLNKSEEALEALRAAESEGQSDAMLLAMLGRAEASVGDADAAISYFEQSVEANPENTITSLALAASYLQADRGNDAISVLDAMPDVADMDFRREMLLITAHIRNGDSDEAAAEGDRLLQAHPDDARAHSVAGAMRMSLGDENKAREHFEHALSLEADNTVALYSLAKLALAEKDIDQARRRIEQLLDAHPTFVPGLSMLAAILHQDDALDQIRPRTNAAMAAAPESVAVHVLVARVALAQNEADEALQVIAKIPESAQDSASLSHLEGLALLQKGRVEQALNNLSRAAAHEPNNATLQFDLARARLGKGDYRNALTAIEAFRALRPDDVRGLVILVEAGIQAGEPRNARPMVEAYANAHPEDMTATMLLGDIEFASGKPLDALTYYEEVAERNWDRQIAFKLSRAHRAAGTGKSPEPLERWLRDNPDDGTLRFFYAQALESSADFNGAVSQYEELLQQGKANAVVLNNLAWHYATQGRPEAVELAEQAHEMEPENGSITDTLGWIVFQSGDVGRALPLLREAASQSRDDAEIQFHLASALAAAGENTEAAAIVQELLESGQSFPSRADAERLAESLSVR
jgi:putative PEP-CTERM system TPR-repeat lipoprotein